jgi:hypothetical protein
MWQFEFYNTQSLGHLLLTFQWNSGRWPGVWFVCGYFNQAVSFRGPLRCSLAAYRFYGKMRHRPASFPCRSRCELPCLQSCNHSITTYVHSNKHVITCTSKMRFWLDWCRTNEDGVAWNIRQRGRKPREPSSSFPLYPYSTKIAICPGQTLQPGSRVQYSSSVHAMKAWWGSIHIARRILTSTLDWVVNITPWPPYPRKTTPAG